VGSLYSGHLRSQVGRLCWADDVGQKPDGTAVHANTVRYSQDTVLYISTLIETTYASVLPAISMVILYSVENMKWRLASCGVFSRTDASLKFSRRSQHAYCFIELCFRKGLADVFVYHLDALLQDPLCPDAAFL
jgi:hypothetical protein